MNSFPTEPVEVMETRHAQCVRYARMERELADQPYKTATLQQPLLALVENVERALFKISTLNG